MLNIGFRIAFFNFYVPYIVTELAFRFWDQIGLPTTDSASWQIDSELVSECQYRISVVKQIHFRFWDQIGLPTTDSASWQIDSETVLECRLPIGMSAARIENDIVSKLACLLGCD